MSRNTDKGGHKSAQIVDDIARVASGAMNVIGGLQQQVRQDVKTRMEDMATDIDLVPREDFDRLEALLKKALQTQDDLAKRIEVLEKKANIK